jgi:hypothetical protein
MINIIPIQQAYTNIFNRQKQVPSLKSTDDGICSYIGELSPSINHYLTNDNFIKHITLDASLGLPQQCPMSCDYCPDYYIHKEFIPEEFTGTGHFSDLAKKHLLNDAIATHNDIEKPSILFGGPTDALLYTDMICEIISFYEEKVVPEIGKDIWYHCYTTGMFTSEEELIKLKKAGVKELLFHLGASNFSETAYNNMRLARKYIDVITVETPSWLKHKKQLFNMLPILEDIGVDHLNLATIDINNKNKNRLDGNAYKAYNLVLDDEGLVYDIMNEVIDKQYSYSVLDLNNFIVMHSQGEAKYCSIKPVDFKFKPFNINNDTFTRRVANG